MPFLPVPGSVLDIGGGALERYLRDRFEVSLSSAYENSKTPYLPEEFLYLGSGLHIWRNLVFHPSYYQTHDEIKLFQKNGQEIASYISSNSTLVDLGSGNLDKIETLLSVLEEKQMQVTYVAVDINKEYLEHAISALSQKHTKVVCQGAYGTFRDAWQWCRDLAAPKVLICLGSSFLRGTREEALATLRSWAELLRPEDLMIIGADGHLAPEYYDKIWKMYHSDDAGWQQLWDNAFAVINDLVGEKWFHSADWKLDATIVPGAVCQHRWRFRAQRDLTLGDSGITFQKGDELGWLDAHKFSKALVHELCGLAGLEVVRTWQAEGSEMHQYLITSSYN